MFESFAVGTAVLRRWYYSPLPEGLESYWGESTLKENRVKIKDDSAKLMTEGNKGLIGGEKRTHGPCVPTGDADKKEERGVIQ